MIIWVAIMHEFFSPGFQTLFDDELSSSTFESLKKGGEWLLVQQKYFT